MLRENKGVCVFVNNSHFHGEVIIEMSFERWVGFRLMKNGSGFRLMKNVEQLVGIVCTRDNRWSEQAVL